MFKNFWFIFMLAVMMIPFESRMIPLYIQYKNWGMLDTYKPLIFGSFAYVYVFFSRQNIEAIPDSLRESAYIDGAGEWRIFLQIIIPLSKPLIATLSIRGPGKLEFLSLAFNCTAFQPEAGDFCGCCHV